MPRKPLNRVSMEDDNLHSNGYQVGIIDIKYYKLYNEENK